MKNKCKICGAPCKSKYCSKKCVLTASRIKYREKHPKKEKFYVFYDKKDFVKHFGTAEQLVEDGSFPTRSAVYTLANKIRKGIVSGSVVILGSEEDTE